MGGLLSWLLRQVKLHKGVLAGSLLLLAGNGLLSAPDVEDTELLQAEFDTRLEAAVAATIDSFQATLTAIPTQTPLPSATPTRTLTPTPTETPTETPTATAPPFIQGNVGGQGGGCDPAYPSVCIPPPPPDLDCGDVTFRLFTVLSPDPHNFDRDGDGVGCES